MLVGNFLQYGCLKIDKCLSCFKCNQIGFAAEEPSEIIYSRSRCCKIFPDIRSALITQSPTEIPPR
jgi:hypothetical protein